MNNPQDFFKPHIISVGSDGRLCNAENHNNLRHPQSTLSQEQRFIETDEKELKDVFEKTILPFFQKVKSVQKALVLHAHGGLVDEPSAIQRAISYCTALHAEVYPISFIWHTGFFEVFDKSFIQTFNRSSSFSSRLSDQIKALTEEAQILTASDPASNFKGKLQESIDLFLEETIGKRIGKPEWGIMKGIAQAASHGNEGAVCIALDQILKLKAKLGDAFELHLVGHSAGAIFHGELLKKLLDIDLQVNSCTLWAAACTVDFFKTTYLPAIQAGKIKRLRIFNLTEDAERLDNCGNIYHKSLLYFISNALEQVSHTPILGMQRFFNPLLEELKGNNDSQISNFFSDPTRFELILSPSTELNDLKRFCTSRHHGDFSADLPVLTSTLAGIAPNYQQLLPQLPSQG